MLRKWITTSIKAILAFALLYWLFQSGRIDVKAIYEISNPIFIAILMSILFLQVLTNSFRWWYLLRGQQIFASYTTTVKYTLVGLFFNFFMPGGVGGDVVKGFYITKNTPDKKYAAGTSVFVDRIVGFLSMALMALIAFSLNAQLMSQHPEFLSLGLILLGITFTFGFLFVISFSRRIRKITHIDFLFTKLPGGTVLQSIYEAIHSYRQHPQSLIWGVLVSLFSQTQTVALFYTIGIAMGAEYSLSAYFFAVPLGIIVTAVPLTPAGIGIGQAAFLYFFSFFSGDIEHFGPTSMTMFQLTVLSWGLVGGCFYIFNPQKTEQSQKLKVATSQGN